MGAIDGRTLLYQPKLGKPVDPKEIEYLRSMLEHAERGEVTSFAWSAVGPDFNFWHGGYTANRHERLLLMANLRMILRQMEDNELQSREI